MEGEDNMDYTEWTSLKVGDRVKRVLNRPKGTIISAVGVGYVVRWDNGKTEKITDGTLSKIDAK